MSSAQSVFLIDEAAQRRLAEIAEENLQSAREFFGGARDRHGFGTSNKLEGTNGHTTCVDMFFELRDAGRALSVTIDLPTVSNKALSVAESRSVLLAMTEHLNGAMQGQGDYSLTINVLRVPNEARPLPDRQRP